MKTILVSLIVAFLVVGCSKKRMANIGVNVPQFAFTAKDMASPAEVFTNKSGATVVRFKLADAKAEALHAFTEKHLNQTVEVVFGSKVIARPLIRSVISDGEIEESFASSASNQAQATANLLNQK